MVEAEAFFGLIERATDLEDHGLPFRYADAFRVDDLGALGLAFKTAADLREALSRLVRYILVLSDTLDYELVEEAGGASLVMTRPHHRRGAQLANECALAASMSALRQIGGSNIAPAEVSFQHAAPSSTAEHWAFFGCPVRFQRPTNRLCFDEATLRTHSRLADEGLSAYLLATLDDLHRSEREPSIAERAHRTVTDSLPDGLMTKSEVAHRLGMSERTLHRRLAEEGESFRSITQRARQEAAESLLADDRNSLAEVAFLTGFGDQSAFQRAFKTWTGKTPLTFRESVTSATQ
jgi:AraC-like DNA-binding protein